MLVAGPAQAAEPTGQELVAHVERLLWGKTNQGTAEMTVITPRWERKIELFFCIQRVNGYCQVRLSSTELRLALKLDERHTAHCT